MFFRFAFSFFSPLLLSVNVPVAEEQLHGEELLDNVPAKTFEQLSHSIPLPKMEYTMKIIMNIIMRNNMFSFQLMILEKPVNVVEVAVTMSLLTLDPLLPLEKDVSIKL